MPVTPRAAFPPQQRNRVFAVILAGVAVGIFAMVLTLAVIFHEVESHHVLAHL
jgi:hypothetical protein